MIVRIWQPAGTVEVPGKGEAPCKFAQGAFSSQIGKVIPMLIEGQGASQCRLLAAEVAGDGSGVTLDLEVLD